MDQMEVVSTASSKESAGSSVGMRRASMVLARSRWANQQGVVTSGCGDLQRALAEKLSADVGKDRLGVARTKAGSAGVAGAHDRAPE